MSSKQVSDLQTRTQPSNGALRERYNSPNRRLSKIPSAANLGSNGNNHSSGSSGENGGSGTSNGQRKASGSSSGFVSKKDTSAEAQQQSKATTKNNVKGRTLIELQQARAGGRPVDSTGSSASPKRNPGTSTGTTFKERVAAATAVVSAPAAPPSAASSVADRNSFAEPVAVWDPEVDEMPSPFLVRRKPMARV